MRLFRPWSRFLERRPAVRLVLYTREACPLCDEMQAEIARARLPRHELVLVDVDLDPVLRERHGRSVPVLEIDGRAAFKGRLSADALERKLARRTRAHEAGR